MDKEREQNSELSRRKLLKSTAAAGLAVSIGVGSESQTAAAVLVGDNPIRKENAKPGQARAADDGECVRSICQVNASKWKTTLAGRCTSLSEQ